MACLFLGVPGQAALAATVRGTAGPDDLRGTMGDDRILAFAGADTVRAFDGWDEVRGGAGNDTISMGDGRAPHDFLNLAEVAEGGPGHDTIFGQAGLDQLVGGGGNDVLRGGPRRDDLSGGDGRDALRGGPGRDFLSGDAGNDQISGGVRRDVLGPNAEGEHGRDRVFMGAGDDELFIENDGQVDHFDCGRGTDTVVLATGPDPLDVFVSCETVS